MTNEEQKSLHRLDQCQLCKNEIDFIDKNKLVRDRKFIAPGGSAYCKRCYDVLYCPNCKGQGYYRVKRDRWGCIDFGIRGKETDETRSCQLCYGTGKYDQKSFDEWLNDKTAENFQKKMEEIWDERIKQRAEAGDNRL